MVSIIEFLCVVMLCGPLSLVSVSKGADPWIATKYLKPFRERLVICEQGHELLAVELWIARKDLPAHRVWGTTILKSTFGELGHVPASDRGDAALTIWPFTRTALSCCQLVQLDERDALSHFDYCRQSIRAETRKPDLLRRCKAANVAAALTATEVSECLIALTPQPLDTTSDC